MLVHLHSCVAQLDGPRMPLVQGVHGHVPGGRLLVEPAPLRETRLYIALGIGIGYRRVAEAIDSACLAAHLELR